MPDWEPSWQLLVQIIPVPGKVAGGQQRVGFLHYENWWIGGVSCIRICF